MWTTFVLGFALITSLSMLKDWWLTGEEPNLWFYFFVPPVDTVGTAVVMFLFASLLRQKPKLLEFLAITFGVAIVMQFMEIITKLAYYKIWEYPGGLYLVFVFPLWFASTAYALVRFTELKLGVALIITVLGLIGSLVIGITFTELTGLETPGS